MFVELLHAMFKKKRRRRSFCGKFSTVFSFKFEEHKIIVKIEENVCRVAPRYVEEEEEEEEEDDDLCIS